MWTINLIDHKSFNVYDNSEADLLNCTELDRNQWSYNAGVLLGGTSTMFNIVCSPSSLVVFPSSSFGFHSIILASIPYFLPRSSLPYFQPDI